MKDSRIAFFLRTALDLSSQSKCERLKVGAIITSADGEHVFALGYNGRAKGSSSPCRGKLYEGNCGCVHAESNAISKNHGHRLEQKVVFCTHLPCELCAIQLINLTGIQSIFYISEYRISEGRTLLSEANISLVQFPMEDLK